jgi:hypothetical protein
LALAVAPATSGSGSSNHAMETVTTTTTTTAAAPPLTTSANASVGQSTTMRTDAASVLSSTHSQRRQRRNVRVPGGSAMSIASLSSLFDSTVVMSVNNNNDNATSTGTRHRERPAAILDNERHEVESADGRLQGSGPHHDDEVCSLFSGTDAPEQPPGWCDARSMATMSDLDDFDMDNLSTDGQNINNNNTTASATLPHHNPTQPQHQPAAAQQPDPKHHHPHYPPLSVYESVLQGTRKRLEILHQSRLEQGTSNNNAIPAVATAAPHDHVIKSVAMLRTNTAPTAYDERYGDQKFPRRQASDLHDDSDSLRSVLDDDDDDDDNDDD